MYKIGLSSTGKDIDEKLFESYSEAGIYGMEVTGSFDACGCGRFICV